MKQMDNPASSRILIEVAWEAPLWESWRKILEPLLPQVTRDVLSKLVPLQAEGEISLALVDNATSQLLNSQYRGQDKPTNVLSFGDVSSPLTMRDWKDYRLLGDVILAFEKIFEEAKEQKKSFQDHVIHLLIHGILHLLGYDHETQDQALKMEQLEITFLKTWGIANPYDEVV